MIRALYRPHGRHDHGQQGQTLVLFALLSLLLLAGLGLIFDAGLDYRYRRQMQNAADIAALRGARVIAQKKGSGYTTNNVLTEVQNTAVTNGVPSTANVICDYLNDSRTVLSSCTDGAIPTNATGVRVRVSETHPPLAMRALGITTTGTAATAAAQVQMVSTMYKFDVPFMVCGVDTKTTSNTTSSIFIMQPNYDPEPSVVTPPTPPGTTYYTVQSPPTIASSAYSYDWNNRDSNGNLNDLGGPTYIIYGSNVQDCGLSNWQGRMDRTNANLILDPTSSGVALISKVTGSIGGTSDASPQRSVNGVLGCRANEYPNGCIMLLPIAHNEPVCPSLCTYDSTAQRYTYSTALQARRWGVFYVTQNGSNTEFYGRLIKNYPLHTDGVTGWDPTSYVGATNITLVRTP